jgi:hypothetical protein
VDLKKAYYYIICLGALFFLLWGIVDLTGSVAGLVSTRVPTNLNQPQLQLDNGPDQSLDLYYQKKMLNDRLVDSLARIVVSGIVFIYSRKKVEAA